MTRTRIIGAALVLLLAGLWFLSERIFFAMNWKDMGLDGPDIIAGLEADLSTGRTGLTTTDTPCNRLSTVVCNNSRLKVLRRLASLTIPARSA